MTLSVSSCTEPWWRNAVDGPDVDIGLLAPSFAWELAEPVGL